MDVLIESIGHTEINRNIQQPFLKLQGIIQKFINFLHRF